MKKRQKKTCVECGIVKDLEKEFHEDKRFADKHRRCCASCDDAQYAEWGRYNPWDTVYSQERFLVQAARNRAMKYGRECTITHKDVIIPEVCPILGIAIVGRQRGRAAYGSPSIDRFDSSKGYTKENIRVISWRANMLKSDGTAEEHAAIARYMEAEQQKIKQERDGKP